MVYLHTLGDLLVDPDLPFGQPCSSTSVDDCSASVDPSSTSIDHSSASVDHYCVSLYYCSRASRESLEPCPDCETAFSFSYTLELPSI